MSLRDMDVPDTESFTVSWYVEDRIILLSIIGDYSAADAKAANHEISDILDNTDRPLLLLIDASRMDRPFNFQRIRALQTFMNHQRLKHIFVVADDKLVTLAMMVIFNMGRAYLHMYSTHAEADHALEWHIQQL